MVFRRILDRLRNVCRVNCGPCCSCSCSLNCSYSGSFGVVPCLNPRSPPASTQPRSFLYPEPGHVSPLRILMYAATIVAVVLMILLVQLFTYHIIIINSQAWVLPMVGGVCVLNLPGLRPTCVVGFFPWSLYCTPLRHCEPQDCVCARKEGTATWHWGVAELMWG